ncbi:MAG: HAMP domain-containing histidine kinase [Lachnospiraceae bacterium]|nr:HAMP domain-containing histidine kinase [Lachnospiraceae bacterium]
MSRRAHIKLKTKMMILFLAIILVPLLCGIMVFMGYGYYENIDMLHELSKKDIMIGAIVNRRLMKHMVIAMVVILILTSGIITAWLNKDIYKPLKELSVAMQHISVGDFDYHMNGRRGDEIGILYDNYEQMRLQLKENEEEKAQNEKKSKELVSNISHDLKTPITSIKGYVEGIMDGVANTPEKMDKYIKTIYNKANDMDRLINELTTYSGIDSNKIPYHFNILNVSDYFSDCVEEVGLDLESKNIHLNFTNLVSADTCVVADPEQLKKVINNIISNSVKYMGHENGEIDIRLLDEAESVKIEIEDDGKGIASKDIGNIFERFYRTDSSRNSLQGGSGIGLSIVKKIIEDHGGYVWATSKEGEGTCMHFVLRKYTAKTDEVVI